MINYAQELNAEQLRVVQEGDGPCLVLAGAGSGKTRTITYRVAYLLEKGIKPENILLVTFTNKAAAEMKERVVKLVGGQSQITNLKSQIINVLPWSGTFHHIAYRILRIYAPALGYQQNFTVLDADDSESIIKKCVKEVKPDAGGERFPSARNVQAVISYARNAERPLFDVIAERFPQFLTFTKEIGTISERYTQKKLEANAMDFDDLLVNFLLLLVRDPRVCLKYAQQFQYILVDEYQDTNKIQASIIYHLSTEHKNILAVGDDAQSIYSFRAADVENILRFERNYPGAKIFKLETNYRSHPEILEVANCVIANNREQYRKTLRPILEKGEKPLLAPQIDSISEGDFIAKRIEELLKEGVSPREIAVLFRAAHHSQSLEVELVKRGIEYDYRGGVRFFDRAHVKDLLSYLRIFSNPSDASALERVLTKEEGIGPAAAEKIISLVRTNFVSTQNNNLSTVAEQLSGRALVGWNNFYKTYSALTASTLPAEQIRALLTSPYIQYLEAEYLDADDRRDDLLQLSVFAEKYADLESFLADTVMQEAYRESGTIAPRTDRIVLSTVHQAKGLEWTAVFIINMSSNGFPNPRALREDKGLAEERRLFYVAITRAKRDLTLTYPMSGGSYGDFLSGPSLFLDEIDRDLLDDRTLLSTDSTVLNDPDADVTYIPEDQPLRPGSFLRSLDDL